MKLKIFFLFLLTSFFGTPKVAANTVTAVMSNVLSAKEELETRSCKNVFLAKFKIEVVTWKYSPGASDDVVAESKVQTMPDKAEAAAVKIRERILSEWVQGRGYTLEQAESLRKIDDGLDPARTSYFSFEDNQGHFNGVRLIDGSSKPLAHGEFRNEISTQSAKFPFEDSLAKQGYLLPERQLEDQTGKPAHLLSIGLLNVDRHFQKGADSLLRNISHLYVDRNYNNFQFRLSGDVSKIKENNLQIYIICRPTHVQIYESFGFYQVLDSRNRHSIKTNEGLHLMKISGADFLKRYFLAAGEPHERNKEDQWNYSNEEKSHQSMINFISYLKSQAYNLKNERTHIRETFKLSQIYSLLEQNSALFLDGQMSAFLKAFGLLNQVETKIQKDLYKKFFERLYVYMYSAIQSTAYGPEQREQFLKPFEIMMIADPHAALAMYKEIVKNNPSLKLWNSAELGQVINAFPDFLENLDDDPLPSEKIF
jgi:hypothetical protein